MGEPIAERLPGARGHEHEKKNERNWFSSLEPGLKLVETETTGRDPVRGK